MQEQIYQLIQSGTEKNILLALELRNMLDHSLDLSAYEEMARFLHEEFALVYDIRSTKKLFEFLAGFTQLHLYHDMNPDKARQHPQLRELPDSLYTLMNLQTLKISNDFKIKELPASIDKMEKLKTLEIIDVKLTQLPNTIGNLSQLETLMLDNCQLKSLPSTIGQMSNLRSLVLRNNQLKQLPDSIGALQRLSVLNVAGNAQLKTLPERIYELEQLEVLILSKSLSGYVDIISKRLPGTSIQLAN